MSHPFEKCCHTRCNPRQGVILWFLVICKKIVTQAATHLFIQTSGSLSRKLLCRPISLQEARGHAKDPGHLQKNFVNLQSTTPAQGQCHAVTAVIDSFSAGAARAKFESQIQLPATHLILQ